MREDRLVIALLDDWSLRSTAQAGTREPPVGCTRELWHDLHCRIDGPVAYDILTSFEERWLKASKLHGLQKQKASYDDALLKIERIPNIIGMTDFPCQSQNDP
ncbi:phospholipase D beta 1-like [Fagus crenata]